jgi:hypothetical protein
VEFDFWWDQDFSLLHIVQLGSGAAQPPIQWIIWALKHKMAIFKKKRPNNFDYISVIYRDCFPKLN